MPVRRPQAAPQSKVGMKRPEGMPRPYVKQARKKYNTKYTPIVNHSNAAVGTIIGTHEWREMKKAQMYYNITVILVKNKVKQEMLIHLKVLTRRVVEEGTHTLLWGLEPYCCCCTLLSWFTKHLKE